MYGQLTKNMSMSETGIGKRALIHAVDRGYRIDKKGVVYGLKGTPIKGFINNKGYLETGIRFEGRRSVSIMFHRLQAYIKFGHKMFDEGIQVRHLDSNALNNSWDNIEIGTCLDNNRDKPQEVRLHASRVAANYRKVLTDKQVLEVVDMHKKGRRHYEIVDHFKLKSKSTISEILSGKLYSSITGITKVV